MAALSIATWNINSVRLRAEQVRRYLSETTPDVLCLQEIKCREGDFPRKVFEEAGYPHLHIRGQRGYHGVAIASRTPVEPVAEPAFCRREEARAAVAKVAGVEIHTYYVPAGGDDPDPLANDKYAHKLDFLDRMVAHFSDQADRFAREPVVITGDLNVAPYENDVWSHKQLLTVVSHTPAETQRLLSAMDAGGFADAGRALIPEPEKLFTWWSYRARDWRASNRGRRLDHIWLSPALAPPSLAGGRDAFAIHDHCRDWEKPSDHAPVVMRVSV